MGALVSFAQIAHLGFDLFRLRRVASMFGAIGDISCSCQQALFIPVHAVTSLPQSTTDVAKFVTAFLAV